MSVMPARKLTSMMSMATKRSTKTETRATAQWGKGRRLCEAGWLRLPLAVVLIVGLAEGIAVVVLPIAAALADEALAAASFATTSAGLAVWTACQVASLDGLPSAAFLPAGCTTK